MMWVRRPGGFRGTEDMITIVVNNTKVFFVMDWSPSFRMVTVDVVIVHNTKIFNLFFSFFMMGVVCDWVANWDGYVISWDDGVADNDVRGWDGNGVVDNWSWSNGWDVVAIDDGLVLNLLGLFLLLDLFLFLLLLLLFTIWDVWHGVVTVVHRVVDGWDVGGSDVTGVEWIGVHGVVVETGVVNDGVRDEWEVVSSWEIV